MFCGVSPFGQQLLPFLQSMSGPAQSPFDQEPLVGQPEAVRNTSAAQVEKPKATATVDAE